MKRYLIFSDYDSGFSPSLGWDSFHNDYDSLEDAENALETLRGYYMRIYSFWYQIVDTELKLVVKEGELKGSGSLPSSNYG